MSSDAWPDRPSAGDFIEPRPETEHLGRDLLANINDLVEEEHRLRAHAAGGPGLTDEERAPLRLLEAQLDRCWDLLRQRRAREEFGQNPDEAAELPEGEIEGYLQ